MNIGYIYKIYDNTNGNKYYGSTKQKLSYRITAHRRDYKEYLNGNRNRKYITSFKIIENGDYAISLVETVEYNDKIELTARERFYIEGNECVNKVIPNRTDKEYREDNKEQKKLYIEVNRERIAEQKKQYYQENKERLLERRKEYVEANKDKIKEQKKLYYEKNKDKEITKK